MATRQIKFRSFGELGYYLFRKKSCPICKSKLKRMKVENEQGFQCWRWGLSEIRFGELNIVTIKYYCPGCKKIRSLSEIYDMKKEGDCNNYIE